MSIERDIAVFTRDSCLVGKPRQAHQVCGDIWWLMGWADNAIEVQLIDESEAIEGM